MDGLEADRTCEYYSSGRTVLSCREGYNVSPQSGIRASLEQWRCTSRVLRAIIAGTHLLKWKPLYPHIKESLVEILLKFHGWVTWTQVDPVGGAEVVKVGSTRTKGAREKVHGIRGSENTRNREIYWSIRAVGFSESFGRFLQGLRSQMRVALRRLVARVTQELADSVKRCAFADRRHWAKDSSPFGHSTPLIHPLAQACILGTA